MAGLTGLSNVREERRFLMPDDEEVRSQLKKRGDTHDYGVHTLYVDTPEGTWSKDPVLPHLRYRIYDDGDQFLEKKLHIPNTKVYVKSRTEQKDMPDNLVKLGESKYTRTEWEEGDTRVTIDKNVRTPGRLLKAYVVETKLPVGAPLPDWLRWLRPYEQNFSKWGWVSG